jgi:hypothetical protein
LCLVFLIWFASGIVMIFKRMPEFSADERLARLPPLNVEAIRFTPAEALLAAGAPDGPSQIRLTSYRGRPAYRFIYELGSAVVYADDGSVVGDVTPADAVAVAQAVFPESRTTAHYIDSITRPDQWTFGNPFVLTGALHRVSLGDGAGTIAYIAEATGEIMMKTDRSSRFWGYLGPVLHWFYFTPLRQRGLLWNRLIIYGSVVGCVLCLLGLIIGVYRFSVSPRYLRGTSRSPYVGWLRWHHYAGLLFGVVTFTWTLSGLLTLTPWNLFPSGRPSPEQTFAVRGTGIMVANFTVTPVEALAEFQKRFEPRELTFLQFMERPFYAALRPPPTGQPQRQYSARGADFDRMLVAATGRAIEHRGFTYNELLAAAETAMPGAEPVAVDWLTDFDAYYYQQVRGRGLPALRVKFNDADKTWLYLDSNDGSLVLAEVLGSRIERWLYQGFHSLDFPGLYQRPWAWYPVVIGLSLGGVALSLTSVIIGWRFVRARVRRAAEPAAVVR